MTTEKTRPADDYAWSCSCGERGEWENADGRGEFAAFTAAKAGMLRHQDAILDLEEVMVSQEQYMGDHMWQISKRSDPSAKIDLLDHTAYPHEAVRDEDDDSWRQNRHAIEIVRDETYPPTGDVAAYSWQCACGDRGDPQYATDLYGMEVESDHANERARKAAEIDSLDHTKSAEVNTRAHELEGDYFHLMDRQNIWDDDSPELGENIADIERQRDEFLMENRALLGGDEHWRGYYEDLDRSQPVSEMNHEALVAQEATLVTSLARNKPPVVAGLLATSQAALMEAQRRLTKATLDVKGAVEQLDGISRWAFRQRKAQGALVVGLEATQNRRLGDRDALASKVQPLTEASRTRERWEHNHGNDIRRLAEVSKEIGQRQTINDHTVKIGRGISI